MSAQHEIADSNGALVAWSGLVAGQALVNFGGDLFGDVPEDRIYRYSNAALALLQFGVILAVVLVIAKRGGPREALALGSPTSWKRAAAIGAFLVVGMMALFAVLGPLLQAGDAQKLAPEWDPNRVVPFAINATVIALVSPVVEELTYRGLGFTVLRRFGPAYAIVVTGTMFALGPRPRRAVADRRRLRAWLGVPPQPYGQHPSRNHSARAVQHNRSSRSRAGLVNPPWISWTAAESLRVLTQSRLRIARKGSVVVRRRPDPTTIDATRRALPSTGHRRSLNHWRSNAQGSREGVARWTSHCPVQAYPSNAGTVGAPTRPLTPDTR